VITIEQFKSLKRDDMYKQLKTDFPEAAGGMSRAKKDNLEAAYLLMLNTIRGHNPDLVVIDEAGDIPDEVFETAHPGTQTGRFDSSKPNEGNTPKSDLPVPAGIEELKGATTPLYVREFKGLKFITKGDPTREITGREKFLLNDLVTLFPKLGPKLESGPLGTPNRRVVDPHKEDRRRVKDALKKLQWAGISVFEIPGGSNGQVP
jgi:hypothetical protein